MFLQVTLVSVSCITILGCENNSKIKFNSSLRKAQYSSYLSESKEITTNRRHFEIPSRPLVIAQKSFSDLKEISESEKAAISYDYQPSSSGNYMTLRRTGKTNNLNNPLYELNLFANGNQISSHITVSGRNHTQKHDRHVSGTEAPLPNGEYKVAKYHIPGTHPEVGGRFLPIYPQFSTGRTALGIHYDPSYDKSPIDDGTAGCIALTNREELNKVLEYVRDYQPDFLDVQIQ